MPAVNLVSAVTRGRNGERVEKLYMYFRNKKEGFTFSDIQKKIPDFKRQYLISLRENRVIKLVNGKIRAIQNSKNPSRWIFTTEALMVLER